MTDHLCKDCRHARNLFPEARGPRPWDWECQHEVARRLAPPDYVTGIVGEPRQDKCLYVRDDPARCGIGGRYWELRE